MTLDRRTGDLVRQMLAGDLWAHFHVLWGRARNGDGYDKRAWSDCRESIANLLDACGLDRRQGPRRLHDDDDDDDGPRDAKR